MDGFSVCVCVCSAFAPSASLATSARAEGTRQYLLEAVDLALGCRQSEASGRDQKKVSGAAEVSLSSL